MSKRFTITFTGLDELYQELTRLSYIEWDAVRKKQLTEMLNRARERLRHPSQGGTPFDTGELRESSMADVGQSLMGYTKDYAPHVEYGHRTRDGGFVMGQRFLQENVNIQTDIYRKDLEKALEKG